MFGRSEAKLLVIERVKPIIDDQLEPRAFTFRRSPLLAYHRRVSGVHQMLELGFDTNPSYEHGNALLVLHPQIRVNYPIITQVAVPPGQPPDSSFAVFQPLGYGGDSATPIDWPIRHPEDAEHVGKSIAAVVAERAGPLFDELLQPEAFVRAYERRDPRILWHRQVVAAVIVANHQAGDREAAMSIAQEWFRGKGLEVEFPGVAALLREERQGIDVVSESGGT